VADGGVGNMQQVKKIEVKSPVGHRWRSEFELADGVPVSWHGKGKTP
jgi:hypothetical protein